ncbi:4-hydroxy-tetrahydrodipicolinate synthase [Amycolatopsis sp. K13G38]|uniref:4-hydroxy-tetrahydrodipicolinate synthase n=1 Tax=Amycolatopsis acididurans TaxID=2724524 RepID=A0ABX1JD38_9PSEU|nr:4-hydroxy-tetrahydrodipicolinate synthase [Amycolatopsis acididurans]NKQ57702.1 4-hydroxy-tetrahydrodipicolinate synthase [Amycolatopsis acididurans]
MSSKPEWGGVLSVLVTPFREDASVDIPSFRRNIDKAIEDRATGIVVAGSTGEFYSLSDAERLELFSVATGQAGGRVPVIGCVNSTSTATSATVELADEARTTGLDGVMLLPPLYVRPTWPEALRFFQDVTAACDLPILAYNNPSRTGIDLTVDMIEELAAKTGVVAVKDSSGDVTKMGQLARRVGDRVRLLVGLDTLMLPCLAQGAHGIVSVVHQALPELINALYEHTRAGRTAEAAVLQAGLSEFCELLYKRGTNPFSALKLAMNHRGYGGGHSRLPILPPEGGIRGEIETLAGTLAEAGCVNS